MKLCRFDDDRLGVVRGNAVFDVTPLQEEIRARFPYAGNGDAVIAALPDWRARIEDAAESADGRPLAEVRLLAPVARPGKLVAAPQNYADHVAEMAQVRDGKPSRHAAHIGEAGLFLKANSSLVGPAEKVAIGLPERRNDYEAELVVVIGQGGKAIAEDDALSHVAGYCLGLDLTVRGPEDRSFRKSLDGYSPAGPWMATPDEIGDPNILPLRLHQNGEPRQDATTADMIFGVSRLIAFASSFYTLHPGDLLFTGTPKGVGPIASGDVLEVSSAPALGILRIEIA